MNLMMRMAINKAYYRNIIDLRDSFYSNMILRIGDIHVYPNNYHNISYSFIFNDQRNEYRRNLLMMARHKKDDIEINANNNSHQNIP